MQQQEFNARKTFFRQQQVMSKAAISKTEFGPDQLQILRDLISCYPNTSKIGYKKLTDNFNKTCIQEYRGFKPKSVKAIQIKVKEIRQIEKHYWSSKLDQLMLNKVGLGQKWKQIAQNQQFKMHGLTANQIKIKFQCGVRNKFKWLYREVYVDRRPPHVSDLTFKGLLREDLIAKYFQDRFIDENQRVCLEDNINLFRTTIDEGQRKRKIRGTETKNKILALLHPRTSLKVLVNAIVKIDGGKKPKKSDVIQQLLCQKQQKRTSKDIQLTKLSPPDTFNNSHSFTGHGDMDNEDGDEGKKIQEIDHQLDIKDDDDIFVMGEWKKVGFLNFQAEM